MPVKESAKTIIDNLPDDATIDDIMHALYVVAKFDRGLEDVEKNGGIPHEEAKTEYRPFQR